MRIHSSDRSYRADRFRHRGIQIKAIKYGYPEATQVVFELPLLEANASDRPGTCATNASRAESVGEASVTRREAPPESLRVCAHGGGSPVQQATTGECLSPWFPETPQCPQDPIRGRCRCTCSRRTAGHRSHGHAAIDAECVGTHAPTYQFGRSC